MTSNLEECLEECGLEVVCVSEDYINYRRCFQLACGLWVFLYVDDRVQLGSGIVSYTQIFWWPSEGDVSLELGSKRGEMSLEMKDAVQKLRVMCDL